MEIEELGWGQVYPDSFALWHPDNTLSPAEVTVGSRTVVRWRCKKGHEWERSIKSQVKLTHQCAVCSLRVLVVGVNDLATTHPHLALEWHPTKNDGVNPQSTTARKAHAWWRCRDCGGDWIARVSDRAKGDGSCFHCRDRGKLPPLEKRLPVAVPEMFETWAADLNKGIDPQSLTFAGHQKVWWRCPQQHTWYVSMNARWNSGRGISGCPHCSGNRLLSGFNDLETLRPDVAAIWHPTLNKGVRSSQVTSHSSAMAWFLPPCGHSWPAVISDLTREDGKTSNCGVCHGAIVQAGFNDLASLYPDVAKEWHPSLNGTAKPESTAPKGNARPWWSCNTCTHEWQADVANRTSGAGCPACAGRGSKAEEALADFIESLGAGKVERGLKGVMKTLPRHELDIYIPEKKIAIEYNGLRWHREIPDLSAPKSLANLGRHKDAHRDKWLACKEQGIQLIQVWEDDWARNPGQVKQMLAHKLGQPYGSEERVMARKTQVVNVPKSVVEEFLAKNHIQGFASGSYYLGLVKKVAAGEPVEVTAGNLLAVLVLKKEAGTDGKALNIIRYATAAVIPGGFTKLLKQAERQYQPEKFITFSDHCVSDGGLYKNNGFVADKELTPDYMYVVAGERKHKFGYRLKRFKNDPDLLWEEGMTERELAQLNGLHRIWDAGKTRWVKDII